MVKGCQKRIIMVQNTGSQYFEAAYLILKNDLPVSCSERDMVNEAQNIVDSYSVEQFISSQNETAFRVSPEKRRKDFSKRHRYDSVVAFFSGAATVGFMAAAISIIANLLY